MDIALNRLPPNQFFFFLAALPSELMIGLAVCGCLLFLLIILLLTVMYRQKDVGGGYSHVMNEGEES